jgi:rSAM/selenodomain-associated transferase 2/rSAM/selenodomain-associated transferase 1
MNPSRLRIVMPVLNEGTGLVARLRALQPLRARGATVVVVDGGSTDSTWAIARRWADVLLLAPRGRASQMNAGAGFIDSNKAPDTLLFLHADTQLPTEADVLIAQALAAGHEWGRFDVRIVGQHRLLPMVAALVNLRSRLSGIATGDQALFVRRSVFEAVGGFADQLLMEDIDLSARLCRRGPPACLRPPVLTSGRRWDQHGLWRTIGLMWALRWAYWRGQSANDLAGRYGYHPAAPLPPFALAVLAKAPVAGFCKTRLIPVLGAAGAARAQRRFTLAALHLGQVTNKPALSLWCAPDASHRFFRAVQKRLGVTLRTQCAGDLGMRMAAVFAQHFESAPGTDDPPCPLLLTGTDCPVLSPGVLQQAAQALGTHDVVLVPAEDGGYVLIGMRRFVPQAFVGIAWSTPEVLTQTRERLRASGASWIELPTLWDVDEPGDWARLQSLYTDSDSPPKVPHAHHNNPDNDKN